MLIETLRLESVRVLNARIVCADQNVSLVALGFGDFVQRENLAQRIRSRDRLPVLVETGVSVTTDSFHPLIVSRLRVSSGRRCSVAGGYAHRRNDPESDLGELLQPSGAVAELIDRHAQLVQHCQVQIGERGFGRILDVTVPADPPGSPPARRIGSDWMLCRLLLLMPLP